MRKRIPFALHRIINGLTDFIIHVKKILNKSQMHSMIEKTPIPEVWKDTEHPKIENPTPVFWKENTVDGSELQRSPVDRSDR